MQEGDGEGGPPVAVDKGVNVGQTLEQRGRQRALDNVFCERLWRSVKFENIYLNQYDTVRQLQAG